jgi:hypothetical protein
MPQKPFPFPTPDKPLLFVIASIVGALIGLVVSALLILRLFLYLAGA